MKGSFFSLGLETFWSAYLLLFLELAAAATRTCFAGFEVTILSPILSSWLSPEVF